MQKRKERSEEKEVPENDGELRVIVADAKAAAAKEETKIRQRTSSTGQKSKKPGAPPPKPRPKSFAEPEVKPRKNSQTDQSSPQEMSFDTEFIPPPPVLDAEDQPTNDEEGPRVSDRCFGFSAGDFFPFLVCFEFVLFLFVCYILFFFGY